MMPRGGRGHGLGERTCIGRETFPPLGPKERRRWMHLLLVWHWQDELRTMAVVRERRGRREPGTRQETGQDRKSFFFFQQNPRLEKRSILISTVEGSCEIWGREFIAKPVVQSVRFGAAVVSHCFSCFVQLFWCRHGKGGCGVQVGLLFYQVNKKKGE